MHSTNIILTPNPLGLTLAGQVELCQGNLKAQTRRKYLGGAGDNLKTLGRSGCTLRRLSEGKEKYKLPWQSGLQCAKVT